LENNRQQSKLLNVKWWQWTLGVIVSFIVVLQLVPTSADGTKPSYVIFYPLACAFLIPFLKGRAKKKIQTEKDKVRTPEKIDAEITHLKETIDFYRNYKTQFNETEPSGIIAKSDEHVIAIAQGVALIESRRLPTTFQGGSKGFSVRVAKGVSVRQSRSRGTATQGDDVPTDIDMGRFVVTDQRGIFVGEKQTREFKWANLVSYQVGSLGRNSVLYLPVTNREKVSGIAGDHASMVSIEERVGFGVSCAHERSEQFLNMLQSKIDVLVAEKEVVRKTG
jgi:hypothetical protein